MHQLPGVSLDFEPGITEYLKKEPVMSNADPADSTSAEPQLAADAHPAVQAAHLVQALGKISMSLAADLVQGADYTFQGHDYLDRNTVLDRVVQWRTQWDALAPARAALIEQARAVTPAGGSAPASSTAPAQSDERAQAEAAYAKRFLGGGAGFPRYFQGWQDRAAVAQAAPVASEAVIIEMAGRIFGFKPQKHDAETKEKYLCFAAELLALHGAAPAGDS